MTTNNGWPGKPGVPLNPDRDRWHWLCHNEIDQEEAALWDAKGNFWQLTGTDETFSPRDLVVRKWGYLGPVLSHDEAAALQARVAELEDLIRVKVTEIERAYPHEGHCLECYWAMRAWSDTEHRDDCWYVKARAALEGGKDE